MVINGEEKQKPKWHMCVCERERERARAVEDILKAGKMANNAY